MFFVFFLFFFFSVPQERESHSRIDGIVGWYALDTGVIS